jgi:BatD DUF11 like domain
MSWLRCTALLGVLSIVPLAHAQPAKRPHRHRPKVEASGPQPLTPEGAPDPQAPAKEAPVVAEAPPPAEPAPAQPEAPAAAPSNPAVQVTTKLDKSALNVGQVAKLVVEVDAPSSIEPSLPEQAFGGLELIDRQLNTQVIGDRTRTTYTLDLLALSAGDANIPALQLRLVGQNGELSNAQSEAKQLRVSSLIANEPNAEPKPASKPLSVMHDDYTLAWVGLGLLAIALVAAATLFISRYLKRRPKPVVPPPPPRPPWELAVERLEQLAGAREALFAEQKGEVFVDGVSDALREYLGRRYGFDGLERTTGELMSTLEKLRPAPLKLAALSNLLEVCDLVKFARLSPDAASGEELWNGALGIVKATTPSGTSLPPLPMDSEPAR